MRRALLGLGLALAVVFASRALAGEKRTKGDRPKTATGTFLSAKLDGELVKWQLTLEEGGGDKTFEMGAQVSAVYYTDRKGVKHARSIEVKGDKEPTPKAPAAVASGKFVSADLQAPNVAIKIRTGEAAAATDLDLQMSSKMVVTYREGADGKLTATMIREAPRKREPKAGEPKGR